MTAPSPQPAAARTQRRRLGWQAGAILGMIFIARTVFRRRLVALGGAWPAWNWSFGGEEMSESWVSVDHVAAHLGVARDSVYRWIESRRLPAYRIGRLWKFKLSEIDAWVCDTASPDGVADDPAAPPPKAKRKGAKGKKKR